MESSKEKIEAQLCAYIEGELDERDRADIERHLQTNPQHKALIAELRKHRDLLQTLPRATVPGELNENLTGQLERSALLSDDDETSEAGVRINRWPQFTAVAAVLLLAVGLGIVVYYVLPPATGPRGPVAMDERNGVARRSPASGPVPEAVEKKSALPATGASSDHLALGTAAVNELDLMARGRGFASASSRPVLIDAAAATTTPPAAAAPGLVTAGGVPPDLGVVKLRELISGGGAGSVTPAEVEELQRRMSRALGGEANRAFNLEPRHSLYLIVETTNAPAAGGQVASFFKANNIQYMNYEGPAVDFATDLAAKTSPADNDRDAAPDVKGGGAYGGGLSLAATRTERRSGGFGGTSDGRGASPAGGVPAQATPPALEQRTQTSPLASARDAATAPAYGRAEPTPALAAGVPTEGGRSPAPAADEGAVARRGMERAQSETVRSRATTLPGGENKRTANPADAARLADAAKSPARADAPQKAMSTPPAPGGVAGAVLAEKAMADAKNELSLARGNASQAATESQAAAGAGGPRPGTVGGQGPATSTSAAPSDRFTRSGPADTSWSMLQPGSQAGGAADNSNPRGGVIVARMNRRQAGELRAALSREQGQRAELRDTAGAAAAPPVGALAQGAATPPAEAATRPASVGKPVDAGNDTAARAVETPNPVENFRLAPHPMDEPVDVVIVVKPETTSPAPAAGEAAKPGAAK